MESAEAAEFRGRHRYRHGNWNPMYGGGMSDTDIKLSHARELLFVV